jgi:aminodeoxychorismate lyase
MLAFLNGAFLPEDQATVSIADRSFRYGDGLFEAILVANRRMFRWPQHAARLEASARFLQIPLPYARPALFDFANELVARNPLTEAILSIQLSRGSGSRGYAPSGEELPLVVMTLHPAPPRSPAVRWKLAFSSLRVATNDPLAHHKTCSRLLQVMAAVEARARGVDECLLLNTNQEVTEGSRSNVFWIQEGLVCTPPLATGILPGVTRDAVLQCCRTLGLPHRDRVINSQQIVEAEGVFLSLTSFGIVEADSVGDRHLRRSPITGRLQKELEKIIADECR